MRRGLATATPPNGNLLTAPWLLAEAQRRDRRGFVVMIDVQPPARGLHELAVAQVPDVRGDDDDGKAGRISFWR